MIELLVGLVLITVLVAYVVPVVMQQVDRWQALRIARDLSHLRVALETFHGNTFDYPLHLTQLAHPIEAADSNLYARTEPSSTFTSAEARRWNGPYVGEPMATALLNTDGLPTGWDSVIYNGLTCLDSTNAVGVCGSGSWVAIFVSNLRVYQFEQVNALLDPGEADLPVTEVTGTGRLIFAEPTGYSGPESPGWTFYKVVPYVD